MDIKEKINFSLKILLIVVFLGSALNAAGVYYYQESGTEIKTRFEQVRKDLFKKTNADGYWVIYSIKKLMARNTFYGCYGNHTFRTSGSYHSSNRNKVLGFILFGKDFQGVFDHHQSVKKMAGQVLNKLEYRRQPKVIKDIAIMMRFENRSATVPNEIRYSNLTLEFDPGAQPIFWLGAAGDQESFTFISNLFPHLVAEKTKRQCLSTIGLHATARLAVPFLIKVLQSEENEKVRGRVVTVLGEFPTQESLNILFETAKDSNSDYIRRKAVYGLEDLGMPAAVDALIYLARAGKDAKTRKRAISALGDIAGKKAVAALKDVVYSGDDTDIKKRAVYAFEGLANGEGIPYLIKIAKTHPNIRVRKSAIYCLGDSKDPRALKTLIEIVKGK